MSNLTGILTVNYNQAPCYDIVFDKDYTKIETMIPSGDFNQHRICIVTDSNVGIHHAESLKIQLQLLAKQVDVFTFVAGEKQKKLETVQMLYQFLIEHSYDRKDALVALGGGVVGDLTGFTAATYLRGIRFFQAPTSLLAMVDSSIGGKTGVDFLAYKNMVGAFYMPQGVIMNLSTLFSLPKREFLSGMGEVIKHGLIKDAMYYQWLKENNSQILNCELDAILPMVKVSCQIKKAVVEQDPKELGERALLNFGHSIGHAVEKHLNFSLLHGECVSIGMVAAAYISHLRGYITMEELTDIIQTLQAFKLPVYAEINEEEKVLEAISKDKKMDAGKLKFILIKGIGNGVIDTTVTKEELQQAIHYIKKKDDSLVKE